MPRRLQRRNFAKESFTWNAAALALPKKTWKLVDERRGLSQDAKLAACYLQINMNIHTSQKERRHRWQKQILASLESLGSCSSTLQISFKVKTRTKLTLDLPPGVESAVMLAVFYPRVSYVRSLCLRLQDLESFGTDLSTRQRLDSCSSIVQPKTRFTECPPTCVTVRRTCRLSWLG